MPAGRGRGRGHRGPGSEARSWSPGTARSIRRPPRGAFLLRSVAGNGPRAHFLFPGLDGGGLKDKLFGLLQPVVSGLGYELLDIEVLEISLVACPAYPTDVQVARRSLEVCQQSHGSRIAWLRMRAAAQGGHR